MTGWARINGIKKDIDRFHLKNRLLCLAFNSPSVEVVTRERKVSLLSLVSMNVADLRINSHMM